MIVAILILMILYVIYGYVKLARRISKIDKQISEHAERMRLEHDKTKTDNECTKD
jgi:hypothetical protein